MRIGVTISRDWDDYEAIYRALDDAVPEGLFAYQEGFARERVTIVHGASNMDWFVAGVASSFGMKLEAHHADWEVYGKAAGPLRNQKMVRSDLDLLLAFIKNRSRDASGCARMAEQLGVEVKRYTR